jgi:hypothetical protein
MPVPAGSVHELGLKLPSPVGAAVKLTVPVGVIWPLASVSVTVAVHVIDSSKTTLLGEQLTAVEVECRW